MTDLPSLLFLVSQVPWLASGAQGDVLFSVARTTDRGDGYPERGFIRTKD